MRYTFSATATWKGLIISGHLRDAHGAPLVGLEVALSGEAEEIDYTDANGFYDFRRLDIGSYSVTPAAGKWVFSPGSMQVTLSESHKHNQDFVGRPSVDPIKVKHGEPDAVGFEILPPKTGTVTVRIVSPTGRVVWRTDRSVEASRSTTICWSGCDSAGIQVASGVYIASITGAGCASTEKVVILR